MEQENGSLNPQYLGAALLFGVLGLSGYLWLSGLSGYYFTSDSALHLLMSYRMTPNVLSHVSQDAHPPLYYFFLKLIQMTFGVNNPLTLRSVSWISGLVAVYMIFLWGRTLTKNIYVGPFLAFLLATAPFFALQTQVIRNYSLLVCLLTCIFFLFQSPSKKPNHFFWLVICISLLTATHYASILFLPAFLILGFLKITTLEIRNDLKNRLRICWVLFIFLNGTLTLWLAKRRPHSGQSEINITQIKKSAVGSLGEVLPTTWEFIKLCFGQYEAWFILGLITIGLFRLLSEKKRESLLLFLCPIIMAIVLSLGSYYPLNAKRHSLYLLPIILLPVSQGIKWIADKSSWFLLFLWIGIFISQIAETPNIYETIRWRNHPHHFSEIGPSMAEMVSVKETLNKSSFNGLVLLNWDLSTALNTERSLKPSWAVLNSLNKPIVNCFIFSRSQIETLCQCLESQSSDRTSVFLLSKTQRQFLDALPSSLACAQIIETKEISEHFVMILIKSKKL